MNLMVKRLTMLFVGIFLYMGGGYLHRRKLPVL